MPAPASNLMSELSSCTGPSSFVTPRKSQRHWRTLIPWSPTLLTQKPRPSLEGVAEMYTQPWAGEAGLSVQSNSQLHSSRKAWATGDTVLNTKK